MSASDTSPPFRPAPREGTSITRRRSVNPDGMGTRARGASGIATSGIARRVMARVGIVLAIVFVLAIIGGGLYLAYGDFPAPQKPVEKVLPDARFPK